MFARACLPAHATFFVLTCTIGSKEIMFDDTEEAEMNVCKVEGCNSVAIKKSMFNYCLKHSCSFRHCKNGGPKINKRLHGRKMCRKCQEKARIAKQKQKNKRSKLRRPKAFDDIMKMIQSQSPDLFERVFKPLFPRSPSLCRDQCIKDTIENGCLPQLQQTGFCIIESALRLPDNNDGLDTLLQNAKEENIFEKLFIRRRKYITDMG